MHLSLFAIQLQSIVYLVGDLNPSEKYESIGMIIPNIWENKKCSKPPIRYVLHPSASGVFHITTRYMALPSPPPLTSLRFLAPAAAWRVVQSDAAFEMEVLGIFS